MVRAVYQSETCNAYHRMSRESNLVKRWSYVYRVASANNWYLFGRKYHCDVRSKRYDI